MAPGRGGPRGRRFVIVGAGTAGCVLAARLSEDPSHHVTLLEVGPDLTAATTSPEISGPDALAALGAPERLWSDVVVSRVEGRAPVAYPRGRGVGGSSVVNGMLATVGSRDLYDGWAALGCGGWSAADLTPALDRLALPRRAAAAAELGPVDRMLLGALPAAAVTGTDDTRFDDTRFDDTRFDDTRFDDTVLGARAVPLTRDVRGRRVSVVDAYLDPARGRTNLVVRADTAVVRVLCDGGRAVGVELATGETVDADHVVVSAGAIHTPVLLAASGVGTPGVGAGVQDHPAVTFTLRRREPAVAGALAMGVTAALSSSDDGPADLQLLAINRVDEQHGALVLALMDVQSRGRVERDARSGGAEVHFAQLSDERDLGALTRGVVTVARWLRSGAVDHVAEQVLIDDRGTPLEALTEDHDSVARWLLDHVDGHHHASSSCRMGPDGDPSSVVDPRLRVRGVEGLSVCDASVFPRIPTVNVHLPVALVAERAAEILTG